MSDRIHQEVDFNASPDRIYRALTDAKTFAEFSGAGADLPTTPGGAISLFGGFVTGRIIELVPDQRVVQAWRGKTWEDGVYSIARFELKAQGSEKSRIVFDHTGFPEADREHLDQGWHRMYWEPLKAYFSKF
jgi:activator of HSP90 ATPase